MVFDVYRKPHGKPGMHVLHADPCLIYNQSEKRFDGMFILQVDDSLISATRTILNDEDSESKPCLSNPLQPVSEDQALFNKSELL